MKNQQNIRNSVTHTGKKPHCALTNLIHTFKTIISHPFADTTQWYKHIYMTNNKRFNHLKISRLNILSHLSISIKQMKQIWYCTMIKSPYKHEILNIR